MKKNQEIFEKLFEETTESLDRLNLALTLVQTKGEEEGRAGLYLDGLLKRFENHFLTTIHLLKMSLIQEGMETISPLQTIQEAVRVGWVKDPEFWQIALDARSSSINHLRDFSRREYINIITQFGTETEIIINLLRELRL